MFCCMPKPHEQNVGHDTGYLIEISRDFAQSLRAHVESAPRPDNKLFLPNYFQSIIHYTFYHSTSYLGTVTVGYDKQKQFSMSATKINLKYSWTGHVRITEPHRTTKLIKNRLPKCERLICRPKLLRRINVFSMMMERTCMSGLDMATCLFTYWFLYLFICFLTALLLILMSDIRISI
jgi:hypothetical protein